MGPGGKGSGWVDRESVLGESAGIRGHFGDGVKTQCSENFLGTMVLTLVRPLSNRRYRVWTGCLFVSKHGFQLCSWVALG